MTQDTPRQTPRFGVLDAVRGCVAVCSTPTAERPADDWMDLLAEVSDAMTVLAAARDDVIVRLAAIDEGVDEDGVVVEKVNGLGTVSLDAVAMVSAAMGTTTRFAEDLVDQAITRTVRVPALHEAMQDTVLDDYQSRCIASELDDVPHDLARTIVAALGDDMGSRSGPALRQRTRALLAKLSPDLLKERLAAARKTVGLRRRVGEPGTDCWSGTFPSEEAAMAWAAIEALAREYRHDGTYPTLEQARAHALMALVTGSATVETVLSLTVPANTMDDAAETNRAEGMGGAAQAAPDGASTSPATHDEGPRDRSSPRQMQPATTSPDSPSDAHPSRTSDSPGSTPEQPQRRRVSPESLSATPMRRRPPRSAAAPDSAAPDPVSTAHGASAEDAAPACQHAASPSCGHHATEARTAPASPHDATDTAPASAEPQGASEAAAADAPTSPNAPGSAADHGAPGRSPFWPDPDEPVHGRAAPRSRATTPGGSPKVPAASSRHPASALSFVGASGAALTSLMWVPLLNADSDTSLLLGTTHLVSPAPEAPSQVAHPETGALIDPDNKLATDAYRPGRRLKRFVRQRDGRCRFPGCSIPARQCDIDHVIPWPTGPTAATNLICLCRRHHRIKQRHRWRVRLLEDGRIEWTDPRRQVHWTYPVDHLGVRECRLLTFSDDELDLLDGALTARISQEVLPQQLSSQQDKPVELDESTESADRPSNAQRTAGPRRDDLAALSDIEAQFVVRTEHLVAELLACRARDSARRPQPKPRSRPARRQMLDPRDLDRVRWALDNGHFDSIGDALDALDALDWYLGANRFLAHAPLTADTIEEAQSLLRLYRRRRSDGIAAPVIAYHSRPEDPRRVRIKFRRRHRRRERRHQRQAGLRGPPF